MDDQHRPLSYYLKELVEVSSSQFLEIHKHPTLLFWESPGQDQDTELQFGTLIIGRLEDQPEASFGENVSQMAQISVIEVRKRATSTPSRMILVGRSPDNDIVIVDKTISKLHAYFQKAEDSDIYEVFDAGSTNGTKVNEQLLTSHSPHPLKNLDRIDLGPTIQLMYLTPEGFYDLLAQMNRRTAHRAKIRWPVTLHLDQGPMRLETRDLSTGGAYIHGGQTQEKGEIFSMTIEPPNRPPIKTTVEVVWKAAISHLGMGVRFVKISDDDLQFIDDAVSGRKDK
jgi:pSer/pThr/pTyr-binding forkhead associated (FHA) protein